MKMIRKFFYNLFFISLAIFVIAKLLSITDTPVSYNYRLSNYFLFAVLIINFALNIKSIFRSIFGNIKIGLVGLAYGTLGIIVLTVVTILTFGGPFTYENKAINPNRLTYTPINEKLYVQDLKSELPKLGTVLLYFRATPNEQAMSEETEQEIIGNVYSEFKIRIQDNSTKKFVYENTYNIMAPDDKAFEYPIGFVPLSDSKDKTYNIEIVPNLENSSRPPLSIAISNAAPVVTLRHHFPVRELLGNVIDSYEFVKIKLAAITYELPLLIGLLLANLILILTPVFNKNINERLKLGLIINLALLNLKFFAYLLPIKFNEPLLLTTTNLIFSIFFYFIPVVKRFKKPLADKIYLDKKLETKFSLKNDFIFLLLPAISLILFFVFGLNHLGQFMSVDEPKWLNIRVPQLYDAVATRNWEATYINDKPGILPSALSGIVNFFLNLNDFGPENLETYLFYWRLPILVFNGLVLILIYFFLKKLFGIREAAAIFILIALNPILIGISQVVNPDATLWSTSFVAFLSFLIYLVQNNKKYVVLGGVFLGLALLSKFFASFFYLVMFIAITIEYLVFRYDFSHFMERLWQFLKLVLISMIVYTIFFPYTWVNPEQIVVGTVLGNIISSSYILVLPGLLFLFLTGFFGNDKLVEKLGLFVDNYATKIISLVTIAGIIALGINYLLDFRFFDPENYLIGNYERGQYNLISNLTVSAYKTVFSILPFALLGFFTYLIFNLKSDKAVKTNKKIEVILLLVICSATLFLVGSSISGYVAGVRYQILLYPMFSLFILSIYKIPYLRKRAFLTIFMLMLLSSNATTTLRAHPFPLHYYNSLNFKNFVLTNSWGFAGYELAKLVNDFPNSESLNIWVDSEGFKSFSRSNIYWRSNINPVSTDIQMDYLVLTPGGRDIFRRAMTNWENDNLTFYSIGVGTTDLLKIYDLEPVARVCISVNNCVSLVDMNSL